MASKAIHYSKAKLACVFSGLLLKDDNIAVTSEKISMILKAASVDVDPYWPQIMAMYIQRTNVHDLFMEIEPAVAAAAAPAAAKSKVDENKEEETDESDEWYEEDMRFGEFC